MFLPYSVCLAQQKPVGKNKVTLASLLEEMISFDSQVNYPVQSYTCKQVSSYDRRTISPDKPGWFANDDGAGYVRLDSINGRKEKVMFEAEGPGVVTRIWMTTLIKNGVLRFYFDGSKIPAFEIQGYDMNKTPFYAGKALSLTHTHYTPEGKGGNTFMLPLPYQKSCRITFEEPDYSKKIPRYYHINYRTYKPGTQVQTFTLAEAASLQSRIEDVNSRLLNPPTFTGGEKQSLSAQIDSGERVSIDLPKGTFAIKNLAIDIKGNKGDYGIMMRNVILKIKFDGKETVRVPLSDFSGAGFGSRKVDSWYISADGKGSVTSRWVMPYKSSAQIELENLSPFPVTASVILNCAPWSWGANTLYFHTSWKEEKNIPLNNQYDNDSENLDWNFVTLSGRGIYKGDLMTLFNYAPDWYGEGDEKIWVDDDKFPSFIGTGTEDYYNCSWAPVVPFYTPFGGAPRADNTSSYGYNSFLRTRNLDNILFTRQLKFDLEMLSWNKGKEDCSTTVFWYGDAGSSAKK
ncbi:DUF2961 domain-containing protein [Mucilaginibacter limnophilus]|uniref:DUF2961 domain-containing protein n=2 Tax=Mucilaginibacter limnophilus TaxID=1932778 RepID=A0A3S2V8E4_9SPHI|nr:DUF2961 domain-containing protein [Mucilaginibacter limnophilus]